MDSPPPQRKAAGFIPPPGLGSPVQETEAMQRRPEDMAGANVPGRGLDQAMADYAFQNFQNWSPPNAGKGSAGYGNRAMPVGPSRAPGAHLAPQPGGGMMAGSAGSGKGSAAAQSALQSLQMFQGSDGRGAEETSAMQRAAAEQLQKQKMAEANRNDPDAQRSAAENAALENARRLKNSPLVQDLASRNANVSKGKEEKRYQGILKVFRPEHGWGFIENPELKNKYGHDVFLNQAVEGGIKLGSLVSFTLEMSKDGKPQARNARMEAEKVDRPKTSAPGQEARELVGKVFKGRVKSFNATNGFGFLTCEELKSKFAGRAWAVEDKKSTWVSGNFPQLKALAKSSDSPERQMLQEAQQTLFEPAFVNRLGKEVTLEKGQERSGCSKPGAADHKAGASGPTFRGLHGRRSNFKLVEAAVDRVYSSVLDGNAHYYKALVSDPVDFSTYQALLSELEYKPAWMSGGLALHRPTALGSESQLRQSPTYERIVRFLAGYFGVEPIRSLVNHYRSGEDFTSFHSDQYFSGVNMTIGASFGEERALVFEHRETKEQFSFPQHNGDVFAFTDSVNRQFVHGVPRERRARSMGACGHSHGRISVIVWGRRDQELWKTRAKTLPLTLQPLNVLEHDPSQATDDKDASLDADANRLEPSWKDEPPHHDGLGRAPDTRPARWKTFAKSQAHGY
ncbi:unnamed protein product [Symbiodinium sp. CCMP2592]|nr:unnamed protein product [Symbiodinium sp. CCMP2592]